MKSRLMIGAATVALLGFTACGSSGDDSLDKQDFIAQADAICRKATDTRSDVIDDITNASLARGGRRHRQGQAGPQLRG